MTEPGIAFGDYYRLSEIILQKRFIAKKVVFEFQNGFVLADGKVLQGHIKCLCNFIFHFVYFL